MQIKDLKKKAKNIIGVLSILGASVASIYSIYQIGDLMMGDLVDSYRNEVYQPENVTLVETALEDELQYYEISKGATPCTEDCDANGIKIFKETVKPKLDEILSGYDVVIPASEPKITTGVVIDPTDKLIFAMGASSFIGLLYYLKNREDMELSWGFLSFVTPLTVGLYFLVTMVLSNYYNPKMDIINISSRDLSGIINSQISEEGTAMVIGHEYLHFIEDKTMMEKGTKVDDAVTEGISRWITDKVARELYTETGNPDFLVGERFLIANELSSVYQEMCTLYDIEPRPELIINDLKANPYEDHTIGTALFKIAELRHGDIVYVKVLSGDFSILFDDTSVPEVQ